MPDRAPSCAAGDGGSAPPSDSTWTIATRALELTWSRVEAGDIQLTSLQTAGHEWLDAPTSMFSCADDPRAEVRFQGVEPRAEGSTFRLWGTLSPSGATVSTVWTVYDAASVVVAEVEVINETDHAIQVGNLASLCFRVRPDHAQLGGLAGGRWDEALPPRGYRLQTIRLDEIGRENVFGVADDGRSSGEQVPWFALMNPDGGLLAALVWSGRWRLTVSKEQESRSLVFGISDFAHALQPGERLTMPGIVLSGYAGDLDDGANIWRDWIVTHWMPSMPESWPWVQYNHWYAYDGDISADRLSAEARDAAQVGCEVFVVDDGWFRGRRPESYDAGWGDWVEDRVKFPDGLQTFGSQMRDLGMKFGLWVEPERADPTGELIRQHPDWVSTREGEPISRRGQAGAEGVHLCLGNLEVQQWMLAEMIRVVQEYGVDWLKWDYNIGLGLGCDGDNHGHQTTDGHHAHTLGLYRVLSQLRAACPDLVIENCASGGHRVDLGILRYTHTNWISDYTHRAASCRQHVQGAGLFLPLQHLNTWVLNDRSPTECRSRMGGAFGVSSRMGQWTELEREAFGRAVSEYKRLRPFLGGERFLLTGPLHQDWDIWQFGHPSAEQFAVIAFREAGRLAEVRVEPRISFHRRSYLIERTDTEDSVVMSGAELSTNGLTLQLPEQQTSEIIWVTAIP